MSEAELFSSSQDAYSNAISVFGLFITLLSAYLVAAYVAGASMTRSQVGAVNGLYMAVQLCLIGVFYSFGTVAHEVHELSFSMSTQRGITPIPLLAEVVTVLLLVSGMVSLKFMWDVRHPKPD